MDFAQYAFFGEDSDSLSIRMINSFFDELKAPAVCIPFPADGAMFLSALSVLRKNFAGFNVSADYALMITPHIDKLDMTSKNTGAVSTVKSRDGKTTGYDTDCMGFERSLQGFMEEAGGGDILIIGADALAYPAGHVLLKTAPRLFIFSGDAVKARMLRDRLSIFGGGERIRILGELSGSEKFLTVFNTQTNKRGAVSENIPEGVLGGAEYAYDVNPAATEFLRTAARNGAKTKDGFDYLFFKSLETVKIWLEKPDISLDTVSKVYGRLRTQEINVLPLP